MTLKAQNAAERLTGVRRTLEALGPVESALAALNNPPGESLLLDANEALRNLRGVLENWIEHETWRLS